MLTRNMIIRQFISGMVGVVVGLLALWTILLLLGHPMEWQALLSAWPAYVCVIGTMIERKTKKEGYEMGNIILLSLFSYVNMEVKKNGTV